jgi:hypothetical protein
MTNAVSTRMPRVSPDKAIVYKDWVIPKGVSISAVPSRYT